MIILKTIVILIFYTLSCIGLGGYILKRKFFYGISKIHASNIRFFLFSYLLGFSIFSIIFLLLSIAGLFYAEIILVLILPAYVYVIISLRKNLIKVALEGLVLFRRIGQLDIVWKIIAFFCLAFYLFSFSTFGRPLSFDGAQLYLPWAKIIAASHHLVTVPGNIDYSLPGIFTEIHYAAFMSMDIREACILNDLVLVTGIALFMLLIGGSLGIKKEGYWTILAFLFTSPVFIWLIGKGTPDLAPCLLGLASIYLLIPENDDFNIPLYSLAGFFCGLTIYSKLSYMIGFFPVIGGFVLLRVFANKEKWTFKQFWKNRIIFACLAFGISLFIGVLPLIIKNTYIFGNPFNPPEGSLSNYTFNSETQFENLNSLLRSLPLSLFYGLNSWKSGRLSPLILAFLPFCLCTDFLKKRFINNILAQVTLTAIIGLMLWVLLRPSSFLMRYFLATLLLFVFLPAWSLEQLWQNKGFSAVKITIILIIPIMLFSEFSSDIGMFFFPKETVLYSIGAESECDKDGYHCNALRRINREAKPGDRVLFAEWSVYWLRADLLQCMVTKADRQVYQLTPISRSLPVDKFGLLTIPSFNDLWKEIYERGFTYIVRTKKLDADASKLDLNRMAEVPWVRLVNFYDDENIEVYRIEYNNPPFKVKATCNEISPGYWQLVEKND